MFNDRYRKDYDAALGRLTDAHKAASEFDGQRKDSDDVHYLSDEESQLINEVFDAQNHYRDVSRKYFGQAGD